MSLWASVRSSAWDRRRERSIRLPKGTLLALVVLLAATESDAAAQQTGNIIGRVTAEQTGAPLNTVQVFLPATGTGTLTDAQGRFNLLNVAAGTHELQVVRIGFRTATQTITVVAGESVEVNFALAEDVLGLDEIVVTGETGMARRREVGNTVSQINMSDVTEPVLGFEALLQGRASSVSITESAGSTGAGAMMRLRGVNSVTMTNQPLVYIDGVRMRSDPYPRNVAPGDITNRSVNVFASPLNDIDPNSIERVEIIKGAAATALYGTEASAGVIQIFTKRGTQGNTEWEVQVEQGFSHMQPLAPGTSEPYMRIEPWLRGAPSLFAGGIKNRVEDRFAQGDFCSPEAEPGACDYSYEVAHRQRYHVSARGGLADMTYFVAGSLVDNKGMLPNDAEEKLNVRGNFGFSVAPSVHLQWNTSLTKSAISNTPSGNNSHGIILNTYRKGTSYVGGYTYDRVSKVLKYDINTDIDHLTTGATASFSPSARFNTRLTVGLDRSSVELRQLRPFGFVLQPGGVLGNTKWVAEILNVDAAANYTVGLSDELGLTLSIGGQATEEETTSILGHSENFPGPGLPTLSSGGLTLSFEDRTRIITAGMFGQVRTDWRDRVFVTLGLRADGNSAFGEEMGTELYPKASLSWVISDESFWKPSLGSLKLRGAVGEAGRAPGAFDAVRTWDPTRFGNNPGFLPRNLGNAQLGPERSREYEAGLDASVLDNRVTAEFTYFHQVTNNALLGVRSTPSQGGWGSQLENVGKLQSKGVELALNATVLERDNLSWDLGLSYATLQTKALDLGGAPPFSTGGQTWVIEGQPVPVVRGFRVRNPDELAEPDFITCADPGTGDETEHCIIGPNHPTRTIAPSTRIGLPGGITVSARGEYLGGFYMNNSAMYAAISRGAEWATCGDFVSRIVAGDVADIPARFRAICNPTSSRLRGAHVYKADFFKLRDITAQFPLGRVVPWGESPTLTLSARNWIRWHNDEWKTGGGLDPEMSTNSGYNAIFRDAGEHIPAPATFTMAVRVRF